MRRRHRIELPELPRRKQPQPQKPQPRRERTVTEMVAHPALLVMGAVIAVAIPAAPRGSWAPGAQGVAAFTTVVAVKPAARVGIRAVQRRIAGRR